MINAEHYFSQMLTRNVNVSLLLIFSSLSLGSTRNKQLKAGELPGRGDNSPRELELKIYLI